MVEPLSITAGIAGIVGLALDATRELIDDVHKIIDAPEAIRSLREDLKSTAVALESLQKVAESEWQSLGSVVAEQSKDAVKTCKSACNAFGKDLRAWTRHSQCGELSKRDRAIIGVFKERQIKAMSEHLQSCKLTCSSVVGMGTLYVSLRTGHITEELMNTVVASRNELANFARRNDSDIATVRQHLEELNIGETASSDDEEDDRIGAEAQLSSQKAALELSQSLVEQLRSMLQDEKIAKIAAERGGSTNVSIGSITNGFGIGINNAQIGDVTIGTPMTYSTLRRSEVRERSARRTQV